ncbi:arginine repressor [Parascardovia denticolens IPLA 20019]|uniref:Arginine repressor n=1 Tax=Parascardovia denticolens DSM 10105 = JCM 12538 TaxID=864564 RepID=E6K027_PARDN|nr:arginine repressor ArgR [Parascardovia denticolens]EFT84139.1 arginine repressor, C-terminal domain protein [Parascardovia denticolens DSM 10105 = JCM 12538]EIT87740.1 arginine repressor [Parascardovia denticolens IPLA 20019]BAR05032.1 arginine repressor [Parascardovia denticolens DSM 10105 = JCM 12538]
MLQGDTRPSTRVARRDAIERILNSQDVNSQQQLQVLLSQQGIDVTQATLSRDLDEMKAIKIRHDDGSVAYALPTQDEIKRFARKSESESAYALISAGKKALGPDSFSRSEQRLSRVINGLVTSVDFANNLIVVKTSEGAAEYVGSAIDRQILSDILGTIAGDDTVMLVARNEEAARNRSLWILALASGENARKFN